MSTDFTLVPHKRNFFDEEKMISVLKLLCMFEGANFERLDKGVYDITSKELTVGSVVPNVKKTNYDPDEKVGFAIDYTENVPYSWRSDFNPKNEQPSGPVLHISTHGPSVPFTLKFLNKLVEETKKKGMLFNLYDPQQVRFIIKN